MLCYRESDAWNFLRENLLLLYANNKSGDQFLHPYNLNSAAKKKTPKTAKLASYKYLNILASL